MSLCFLTESWTANFEGGRTNARSPGKNRWPSAARFLGVRLSILLYAAALPAMGGGLLAAEPEIPAAEPSLAAVQRSAEEAALAGHNAWMLTSSALVLFMTAPGLAMFYSGLVRKKNVLGVMMQCIFLMALMTVIWALWGYSLSFGGSGAWFGNGEYLFMQNVQSVWVGDAAVVPMEGSRFRD